jgi:hypothetical protein
MTTEVADLEGQAGTSGPYTEEGEGGEQLRSRGACRSIFTACMALVEAFHISSIRKVHCPAAFNDISCFSYFRVC